MPDNDAVTLGLLTLTPRATRQHDGHTDEWYYTGWISWACGGLYLGETPAQQDNADNAFNSVGQALAAATAARDGLIAQIKAPTAELRDLLGGPEWKGLYEAVGRAWGALAFIDKHGMDGWENAPDALVVMRKLADALKEPEVKP